MSAPTGSAGGAGRLPDKRMTEDEVAAELRDGMVVGIGGWGSRRKPMSMVRAILRTDVKDLTIVAYGGPDVGLLCAAGKVRRVVSGFVSLDSIPLEPHYRAARQSGAVEVGEWDEGMLLLGLQAAAWRVPFLPTRAGLGSDVLPNQPDLRTVRSPYPGPAGPDGEPTEGEELVAVPALELDVALVHLNRADVAGNAAYLGPDLFMDDWFALAAERTFLSCERIVPTGELGDGPTLPRQCISRLNVTGVVEAPGGAHFTECPPDHARDEAFQKAYVSAASDPEAWAAFSARFLEVEDEAAYRAAVEAWHAEEGR
jgi:glutaconate CoA-transferase subunit A